VGIAGVDGLYVPLANLKSALNPRAGGFIDKVKTVHTLVNVIAFGVAGVVI
jgi:hypothetical protein